MIAIIISGVSFFIVAGWCLMCWIEGKEQDAFNTGYMCGYSDGREDYR